MSTLRRATSNQDERFRDDLFAAMLPVEEKKHCLHTLEDMQKAHFNARCAEEEWVELLADFKKLGEYAKLKRWLHGTRKAASG